MQILQLFSERLETCVSLYVYCVGFFFSCQCKAKKQGRNHEYLNILYILQDLLMGHLPHMGP